MKGVSRVTVIVPTKNRSTLLRESLASVRALEGPDLDLELIVADNGSTDDTEAVAGQFGARFVQTLRPGASAARNAGLRVATGEFLAFLDDDDIWLPGHLRPHVELLRASPELTAVMGQIVPTDSRLQPVWSPYPEELPGNGDVFEHFLENWPQIGVILSRSSVRESVGYFDEALCSSEDWDWHLRLALRHRIGFVRVPCLLYRARASGRADEDSLNRMRVGLNRRVFWRNVVRAGNRRPSAPKLARIHLKHDGHYTGYFLQSAAIHAAKGQDAASRRLLAWAFETSPLHVGRALVRDATLRETLRLALLPALHRLNLGCRKERCP